MRDRNDFDMMDDDRDRGRGRGRGDGEGSGYYARGGSRACPFLKSGKCQIDYKDVDTLKRYVTEEGKIRPRRQTNVCSICHRALAVLVK